MPTEVRRVLFVLTRGDQIGGAQIHVRDLARALQTRGCDVAVAVGSGPALQDELDKTQIPHYRVPGLVRSINPLVDLIAIPRLARLIRNFRPDLVSCHTAKAGYVGRLAALLAGVPAVFTAHGWQFSGDIPFFQKLFVRIVETLLARLTPRIITVSAHDRDLALRYGLGSQRRVVLVHNGMPWEDRPAPRDRDARAVRLICVARFQGPKDFGTLFQALDGMAHREWTIEFVGEGPELEYWRTRAAERGWASRATFAGQVFDVPQRLARADVFVLSSLSEGFPRSILEAMRAGLPVVASDVGGVREAVLDGETGYVVPPRTSAALGQRLLALVEDPALRAEMGSAGRDRFETEFTFPAMLDKTLRVWSQLLDATRSGRSPSASA